MKIWRTKGMKVCWNENLEWNLFSVQGWATPHRARPSNFPQHLLRSFNCLWKCLALVSVRTDTGQSRNICARYYRWWSRMAARVTNMIRMTRITFILFFLLLRYLLFWLSETKRKPFKADCLFLQSQHNLTDSKTRTNLPSKKYFFNHSNGVRFLFTFAFTPGSFW